MTLAILFVVQEVAYSNSRHNFKIVVVLTSIGNLCISFKRQEKFQWLYSEHLLRHYNRGRWLPSHVPQKEAMLSSDKLFLFGRHHDSSLPDHHWIFGILQQFIASC